MMRVQCYGGPMDGIEVTLDDARHMLHFPMLAPSTTVEEMSASERDEMPRVTYHRCRRADGTEGLVYEGLMR